MAHHRLIVPDPRIRLPTMFGVYLLQRKPFLEVGYTIDLPGYQYHAIKQERWPALLDDLDTFAVKVGMTGWGHMNFLAGGKDNPALSPRIRMQDERHFAPSNTVKHSLESAMMIGMSVRKDNGSQVVCLHFEHIHVVE